MFDNRKAFSSFSVDDLEAAKRFYSETLDLTVTESKEGLELHLTGGGEVFIYPKENHEAASFTVLNFAVSNIEKSVNDLRKQEVRFEQYEGELKTDEKGIHHNGGPKIAWFRDPARNILSVMEG